MNLNWDGTQKVGVMLKDPKGTLRKDIGEAMAQGKKLFLVRSDRFNKQRTDYKPND